LLPVSQTADTHNVEAAARELLESRIAAIRKLAGITVRRDQAREQLAALDREAAAGYAAAQAAGWTPAELKKLGYAAPPPRPRGRPRGGQAPAPARQHQEPPAAAGEAADPGIPPASGPGQ
jgi:hypothetical protein